MVDAEPDEAKVWPRHGTTHSGGTSWRRGGKRSVDHGLDACGEDLGHSASRVVLIEAALKGFLLAEDDVVDREGSHAGETDWL